MTPAGPVLRLPGPPGTELIYAAVAFIVTLVILVAASS